MATRLPVSVVCLLLSAAPCFGQRLPANVTPAALRHPRRAEPRGGGFRRRRTNQGHAREAVRRHRAERRRDRVRDRVDRRRRPDAACARVARCREGAGDAHRPGGDSSGTRGHRHQVPRHPERSASGLLPEQGEQPALCGHAARSDRREADVPLVRRAGVQSDVRADGDHRRRRPRDFERRGRLRYARAGRRQAHGHVRYDAEDVDVPRGAGGRRLRVFVRDGRGHSASRLRDARQEGPDRLCARSRRRTSSRYFNRYYAIKYPFKKLDVVAVPGFRRGRDGEHRGHLLSRDAPARRPAVGLGEAEKGHRRGARARNRPPVVRQSRDDAVVGRHLAERGVRDLDGEPSRSKR